MNATITSLVIVRARHRSYYPAMMKPRILVTGATGKTGAATAFQLMQKNFPVRAFVRCADERSERLRAAGAEIFVGSMEDMHDLRSALRGVQRAYFCPPLTPGTLRRATFFAAAAQEARLEVVVALSQWLTDPLHPAVHSREKWLSSKVFEWMPGVGFVDINPGYFAENYLIALEPIVHFGVMAMPLGEGLNAPPSNEDIARVIVGALTNPAPHIGRSFRPTGPKLLSPEEIAATIGKVLGRRVKYRNSPMKLFLKAAKSLGIPDFLTEELYWFLQDYRRNSFGIGAPTSAVSDVGGSEPQGFEEIARRYVVDSPFAERTAGSMARAMLNLTKALLTSAPDPAQIERRLEIPIVKHAVLAADSAEWLGMHEKDESTVRTESAFG
jgi:NAD(P)H dehydrogenase (quinone)